MRGRAAGDGEGWIEGGRGGREIWREREAGRDIWRDRGRARGRERGRERGGDTSPLKCLLKGGFLKLAWKF